VGVLQELQMAGINFKAFDLGGHEIARRVWKDYYAKVGGQHSTVQCASLGLGLGLGCVCCRRGAGSKGRAVLERCVLHKWGRAGLVSLQDCAADGGKHRSSRQL